MRKILVGRVREVYIHIPFIERATVMISLISRDDWWKGPPVSPGVSFSNSSWVWMTGALPGCMVKAVDSRFLNGSISFFNSFLKLLPSLTSQPESWFSVCISHSFREKGIWDARLETTYIARPKVPDYKTTFVSRNVCSKDMEGTQTSLGLCSAAWAPCLSFGPAQVHRVNQ